MKKYWIKTYGCQMNKSDSERIAAFFEQKKYRASEKKEEADLIIVNMCSIRQSSVDKIHGLSKELQKLNKKTKTILTGCILEKDKKIFSQKFNKIETNKIKIMAKDPTKKTLSYISISNGCNNFCSYCVVPFVRGKLVCRSHKKIIEEIKKITKKNQVREVWLLGQNVNDYKSPTNNKIDFAKLLTLIDSLPGNFKIFFISPHPKNFSDELIKSLKNCQKFSKYINLPIQSGDNEILKKMNRNYTVEEYKNLVKKIRRNIPGIKISTDIIVGFPGETKKQFQNTLKLLKEIRFDRAYIAKYSARPNTTASKLKDNVSLKEKKKRDKILKEALKKGLSNEKK